MRDDADKDEGGSVMVDWASDRGLWLGLIVRADADEDEGGLMTVDRASGCGSWLGS